MLGMNSTEVGEGDLVPLIFEERKLYHQIWVRPKECSVKERPDKYQLNNYTDINNLTYQKENLIRNEVAENINLLVITTNQDT